MGKRRRDTPVAKQHAHFFRDDRHAEQRLVVVGIGDFDLAAIALALGNIVDQESVLERRSGAFHFRCRPCEDANPALLGKAACRFPGTGGEIRIGVERADALLADKIGRKALNSVIVEHQTGCHDKVIVFQRLAAAGANLPADRVDLGGSLGHQFSLFRQPIRGLAHDIVGGLEAGCHKGKSRLIEMFLAWIDQRDLRAIQAPHQPVGKCRTCRTRTDDDDTSIGLDGFSRRLSGGKRQRGHACRTGGKAEKLSSVGLHGAALPQGIFQTWEKPFISAISYIRGKLCTAMDGLP